MTHPNEIGPQDNTTTDDDEVTTTDTDDELTAANDTDDEERQLSYEELLADRDQWKAEVTKLETTDKGALSKEAAGYRAKLRDTERERDDALALVDRLRDHTVDDVLGRAGLDRNLLRLTERSVADFLTEDGLVDETALVAAMEAEASKLLNAMPTRPRRPAPNTLAGRTTGDGSPPSGKQLWDSAFGLQR